MAIYHTNRIDPNLKPENIKKGVSIFGVNGNFGSSLDDFSGMRGLGHQESFYVMGSFSQWKTYSLLHNGVLFVICVCQGSSYNSRCENGDNSFLGVYTMFKSNTTPYKWSYQGNFSTKNHGDGRYDISNANEYFYRVENTNTFVYTLYYKEGGNLSQSGRYWSFAQERGLKITINTDTKTTTVKPLGRYVKGSKDQYGENHFDYTRSEIKPTPDMIPMTMRNMGRIGDQRYFVQVQNERGDGYCDSTCTMKFVYQ